MEWVWDLLRSHFKHLPRGTWSPNFASEDSYFCHNIKKVFRSNWRVINHPWESYSSINIIHIPYQNIWDHLGQFGDLDIKTSERSKHEKSEKLVVIIKFGKRDITSGIISWYWNLMVLKIIQSNKPPPLESELEGAWLVEEELEEKKRYL